MNFSFISNSTDFYRTGSNPDLSKFQHNSHIEKQTYHACYVSTVTNTKTDVLLAVKQLWSFKFVHVDNTSKQWWTGLFESSGIFLLHDTTT